MGLTKAFCNFIEGKQVEQNTKIKHGLTYTNKILKYKGMLIGYKTNNGVTHLVKLKDLDLKKRQVTHSARQMMIISMETNGVEFKEDSLDEVEHLIKLGD